MDEGGPRRPPSKEGRVVFAATCEKCPYPIARFGVRLGTPLILRDAIRLASEGSASQNFGNSIFSCGV